MRWFQPVGIWRENGFQAVSSVPVLVPMSSNSVSGTWRPMRIPRPARADHRVLQAMRAYESALGWTWPQPKVLDSLGHLLT